MWGAHEGMGWWMIFAGVLWLIFWASVIYLLASALSRALGRGPEPDDPMEIAKRRYARGEITREEFESIRRTLLEPPGRSTGG